MAVSEGKSYFASGNISCNVFTKIISQDDFAQAQCTTGDKPYGVSFGGSYDAPGVGGSTAYAATTGQSLLIYHEGDVCLLVAGTAGFNAGDRLMPDVNGYGTLVTTGSWYGAIANQTTPAGALGRVEVEVGKA